MKTRKSNGEGSCRKIAPGKYECVIQSNLINPKTLKPKRFMRRGSTEKEARLAAIMAMILYKLNCICGGGGWKIKELHRWKEILADEPMKCAWCRKLYHVEF